jgi:hypothetical protein
MRPARGMLMALALASVSVAAAQPSAGAEIGRLFFTPQQRQDLDRRRQTNAQESIAVVVESLITVNGHVSRSGGHTTTWINGVPQQDSHRSANPAQLAIQPTEAEPTVSLKIGQTLDRARGEVREGYGRGEVKVRPGAR